MGLTNPKVSQVGGMPNALPDGGGITKLGFKLLFKGWTINHYSIIFSYRRRKKIFLSHFWQPYVNYNFQVRIIISHVAKRFHNMRFLSIKKPFSFIGYFLLLLSPSNKSFSFSLKILEPVTSDNFWYLNFGIFEKK